MRTLYPLLIAGIAFGQSFTSGPSADAVTYHSFRVTFSTTVAPSTARVYYQEKGGGCPPPTLLSHATSSKGGDSTIQLSVPALAPDTTYCWAVNLDDGAVWSAVLETRTSPLPSAEYPIPPREPETFEISLPHIDGNTYNVASDCSDLQSQIDVAASQSDSLNHQVVIPATAVCTGSYNLPSRSGTGWVVLRTSSPNSELPPDGVRATPVWANKMPTLQTDRVDGQPNAQVFSVAAGGKKYYLFGLHITHATRCTDCIDVTSATNASPIEITTASPHGRSTGDGIEVFAVGGNMAANGQWQITVTGSNTLTLDNSTGNGSYTSGGAITRNPTPFYALVVMGDPNVEDILIDRCLLRDRGFPYRVKFGVIVRGTRIGIVNSSFRITAWRGVNPVTRTAYGAAYGPNAILGTRGAGQWIIRNNYIESHGVPAFVEVSYGAGEDQPYNIVFQRNYFYLGEERRYPHASFPNPASNGRYYLHRQHLEFKWGGTVKVDGNIFDGNWTGVAAPGQAINIFSNGNGATYGLSDYTITNNTIRRSVGGIQIQGRDTYNKRYDTVPSARIRVSNNLMYGIYRMQDLGSTGSYSRGTCFNLSKGGTDFLIEHNTCYDNRGTGPSALVIGWDRFTRMMIRNNVFTLNLDSGLGGLSVDDYGNPTVPPYPTGTLTSSNALTALRAIFYRGTSTDHPRSNFVSNVFIPGVRDTLNTGSYDSNSMTLNYNAYSCGNRTAGLLKDFLDHGNVCVGNNSSNDGSETANQRFALMRYHRATAALARTLDPALDFRLRYDSPFKSGGANRSTDGLDAGVDIDQLEAAQGMVKNLVADASSTDARISYLAPDSFECTVEYGTSSAWGSGLRLRDGGGDRVRNVHLSELWPGTAYYYRVFCAVEQPEGFFITTPGEESPPD